MTLRESFSRTQRSLFRLGVCTAHRENQRHEVQQVDVGSIVVCEETCTTIRRFDSPASHAIEVGTGPEEHLLSDFEHMKTSLHLTDVVVLRHEGDTVNFLGP